MSKEPSTLLLEHHLKVLKLPTFVRDYAGVAAVLLGNCFSRLVRMML
jgi:hypothetical protein